MENKKQKIVCVHLLNDFSGSPKVLSQLINEFITKGHEVDVFTSNPKQDGFLSNLEDVNYNSFFYRWSPIKLITLVFFFLSQFMLFFKLLRYRNEEVVIYVNTILPIGAALAGKLMKKKVIYHVHETSISPLIFKKFLFSIAENTASEAIYVSNFLLNREQIPNVKATMVYNALSEEFIEKGVHSTPLKETPFTVLMLCSLKEYKGVYEFVTLSESLPQLKFELVINSTQQEINAFFKNSNIPTNLTLFPSQNNVHPFYERAHLVLNLSHPLKWVETFGMTALEAMCYGIPVIVPPVGGIAELVDDGVNGYQIDVRNTKELKDQVLELSINANLYVKISANSRTKSNHFEPSIMASKVLKLVETV